MTPIRTDEKTIRLLRRALKREREFGPADDPARQNAVAIVEMLSSDYSQLLDYIEQTYNGLCKSRLSPRDRALLLVNAENILRAAGRQRHEPGNQTTLFDPAEVSTPRGG